jgi:hypothetical protein
MVAALLVGLSLLAALPVPEDAADPLVREGITRYRELRYREALLAADQALASAELPARDRSLALAVKGRVHAVLQEAAEAHAAFVALIQLDPVHQVGWDESPLITLAFQRAKETVGAAPVAPPEPAPASVDLRTPVPPREVTQSHWPWIVGAGVGVLAAGLVVALVVRGGDDAAPVDVVSTWQLP